MGIYSDYGRFMKARQFKEWCNSGAGIWFGFGLGSPRWDDVITYSDDNNNTVLKAFVPPSSPAAFTSVYRWFRSEKGIPQEAEGDDLLSESEMSLLDRSFGNPSIEGDVSNPPYYPSDDDIRESFYLDGIGLPEPNSGLVPSICKLGQFDTQDYSHFNLSSHNLDNIESNYYPSLSIPPFSVAYEKDWMDICNKIAGSNLDFSHMEDLSNHIPSDPEEYEAYSYAKHVYTDGGFKFNPPLGLLSFIQGTAKFVVPVEESEAGMQATFKYGSHYWKVVSDNDISRITLPHHILLTVNVFPNELSGDSISEQTLTVRQVSVFKFPLGLKPIGNGRAERVFRRNIIDFVHGKYTGGSDLIERNNGTISVVHIPFNCEDPLNPDPVDENTGNPDNNNSTIELLINDFMTARKRVVQQTDRYGYIIGF